MNTLLTLARQSERRMRYLITGGAGFLGSHLIERLLLDGHNVICLDNFYTGTKDNLKNFIQNDQLEVIRGDVTEPFTFEVDAIMNLACPASPVHYQRFPVETTRTSVLGALNSLDLARKLDIPVFQASTSEVYGDPTVSPQNESYWGNVNPIGIRSCYDEGKRAAETLYMDYSRQYGTKIRIARIFNTYGPRMSVNDGRVVSNFIVQALQDQPITIYGDGSFCYVTDLIDAFVRIMKLEDSLVGPINLGNPGEFTILQLAEKIIELTGSRSSIEFELLPSDDPKQRKPDISLASTTLGWKPSVDLNEGLNNTIEYFKEKIGTSNSRNAL
jgi:UDP-glucuronate decarboxylase